MAIVTIIFAHKKFDLSSYLLQVGSKRQGICLFYFMHVHNSKIIQITFLRNEPQDCKYAYLFTCICFTASIAYVNYKVIAKNYKCYFLKSYKLEGT